MVLKVRSQITQELGRKANNPATLRVTDSETPGLGPGGCHAPKVELHHHHLPLTAGGAALFLPVPWQLVQSEHKLHTSLK